MFFLGTANPRWLSEVDVPLCLAYHHLAERRTLPRAKAPWLLDSGAYNRLSTHGGWDTLSPDAYVAGVRRLADEVGNLAFAGQMDWLVGDEHLGRTGLPTEEHLWNTVTNYVDLVELWGGDPTDCPIIPSLQGRTERDFHLCWDLFDRFGVDLAAVPRVGIGSIAAREATPEVASIVESLLDRGPLVLHGYGVKGGGLRRYGHLIRSADSAAWSYGARRAGRRHPNCTAAHATCSSCPTAALTWREQLLVTIGEFSNPGRVSQATSPTTLGRSVRSLRPVGAVDSRRAAHRPGDARR